MTPAKIYQFSIPAGGSFPLLVIGDYCKILTSSGPLTLQGDTFGSIGPILAGQGVQDSPFSRLVLEDESGATNNGTILIADNAFIDDRITGEVSVIDGSSIRAKNGGAFTAHAYVTANATLHSTCQIWNPAGSGKKLIIESIIPFIEQNITLNIKNTNAIIANGSIYNGIGNKKSTGPTGVAVLYTSSTGPGPEVANASYGLTLPMQLKTPFVIEPGHGLNFASTLINKYCGFDLEFYEESL
jgi:hypothetical protein